MKNSRFKNNFFYFLCVLSLIVFCAAFCLAVLAPLWLFASKAPAVYSKVVAALVVSALLFFCIKQAKKAGVKKTLFFILKAAEVFLTLFFALRFLFNYSRLFALFSIIAGAAVFRITAFFTDRQILNERQEK